MTEYTIDIETTERAATSEDVVDRVTEELAGGAAVDPSVSINTETGVVAATFQVQAKSIPEAADIAIALYGAALVAAGVEPDGTVAISKEVASLTIAPTHERELAGV